MKVSLNSDELDDLEKLDDGELAALIRESLKKFRGQRTEAEDDETPETTPGGGRHGAPSTATLETQRSRSGNVNPGATDSAIAATQDAARQTHEARLRQDERDAEAAKLIPGYRRL